MTCLVGKQQPSRQNHRNNLVELVKGVTGECGHVENLQGKTLARVFHALIGIRRCGFLM